MSFGCHAQSSSGMFSFRDLMYAVTALRRADSPSAGANLWKKPSNSRHASRRSEYFPLSSSVLGGSYTATWVRTLSTSLLSDAKFVGRRSESSECVRASIASA